MRKCPSIYEALNLGLNCSELQPIFSFSILSAIVLIEQQTSMLSLCPCVGGSIKFTSLRRSQLCRSPYKINLQSYGRISPRHSLILTRREPSSTHAFRLHYSPLKPTAEISTQGPDQGKDRCVVAHAQSTSGLVDEIVAEQSLQGQASPSPKTFGDELALQSDPSIDSGTSESSSTSKVSGYGPFRPLESSPVVDEAWFLLKSSVVSYLGEPVSGRNTGWPYEPVIRNRFL